MSSLPDRTVELIRAQAYVRGTLTDSEREAFEIELAENRALMDALEVESALMHGLRASRLHMSTSRKAMWPLALGIAASLLLGIGIGRGMRGSTDLNSSDLLVQSLYVDELRGAPGWPVGRVGETMVLELPMADAGLYRFRIEKPDGSTLPAVRSTADASGLIRILIPASWQTRGKWRVTIIREGKTLETRTFELIDGNDGQKPARRSAANPEQG